VIALGNRRLWLCGESVDMRKGIDGLIRVVQQRLLREAMTGEVFLVSPRVPPESPTAILRRVSNFHSIVVQIRPFQVTSGKAGSGRAVKDAAA
jgi:hypothetical protein